MKNRDKNHKTVPNTSRICPSIKFVEPDVVKGQKNQ